MNTVFELFRKLRINDMEVFLEIICSLVDVFYGDCTVNDLDDTEHLPTIKDMHSEYMKLTLDEREFIRKECRLMAALANELYGISCNTARLLTGNTHTKETWQSVRSSAKYHRSNLHCTLKYFEDE